MKNWIFRGRWGLLFLALVLQMLFNPCMELELENKVGWALIVLNCFVVVAIIFNLSRHWYSLLISLLLGIPIVVLYWLPPSSLLQTWTLSLSLALYAVAIFLLLPALFRAEEVGFNELFGAGSLYLLIGFAWAVIYALHELLNPGSFHSPGEQLNLGEFTYFSFVTLTTLGYGDIVPLTCKARALTSLEAMSGILTLSVVVARIIGLHAARVFHRRQSRH